MITETEVPHSAVCKLRPEKLLVYFQPKFEDTRTRKTDGVNSSPNLKA